MVQFANKDLFVNNRNPELFEELFNQYSKPLFYYAAKFVEDEVARDIVQDVFAKLWSDQKITIKLSLNSFLLPWFGTVVSKPWKNRKSGTNISNRPN